MTKFVLKSLFLNPLAVLVVSNVHSCGLRATERKFYSLIRSEGQINKFISSDSIKRFKDTTHICGLQNHPKLRKDDHYIQMKVSLQTH